MWKVGDLYRYQYDTNYFAIGVVVKCDQFPDAEFIEGREIELRQTHKVTEALTRLGGV